jgi:adenylate kinase family enzyme
MKGIIKVLANIRRFRVLIFAILALIADLLARHADGRQGRHSARLAAVLEKEAWIVDGNYASTMEMRLAACDMVFFLDYPLEVCLDGVRARRGKPRADMPWIEAEEDAEFTAFIKKFNEQQRPQILKLLERYNTKRIFVFQSRRQADAFLEECV